MPQPQARSNHAIVIGGSIAGLFAARVLLNHFQQVTLIERDSFPNHPGFRPGVPQSQHVHILLTQGQRYLEQLFPGILAELTTAGAPTVNWTAEWCFLGIWGWHPRLKTELQGVACSRILLEYLILQRLKAYANLTILESCQVQTLLRSQEANRISGVRLNWRKACSSVPQLQEDTLSADLVVDASGRNSALPKWLTTLGYSAPEETVVNSFLGYASRWYEKPEGFKPDWQGATLSSSLQETSRGGTLFPIEGDRWILTLGGIAQDQPPTDEQGFLEFANSLRSPLIYDAIKDAKPLSPIYAYRRTENCWRHYEKLNSLPEGIVALGDAVCAFNPVYGQGMTIAAQGAITLDQCLRQAISNPQPNFSSHFQQCLAQIIATPWIMATAEDSRWPTTVGAKQNWLMSLMQGYTDEVLRLVPDDPDLLKAFANVIHLVEPPATLFQPGIALKVLGSYSLRSLGHLAQP
mgnify:CR=1 FL=1